MPKFTLAQSRTIPLTKDLAEQMYHMKPSPTERALDPKRVEYLRGQAKAGLLVPFQWAKAKVGADWVRMNGQHSSEMLCALPAELFPAHLSVHLDEYDVENVEALTALFQQFDARKSVRSRADVAGAYKGLHEELSGIPLEVSILGVEGFTYYRRNVHGVPTQSDTQIFEFFAEQSLWPFLKWLPEVFTVKTPELRKKEIVAAMYITFDKNEEQARTFWKEVQAGGNPIEEYHPTRTLDAYYVTVKEETDKKKKPRPHELYQAGILAWNAWREGKKMQTIKRVKNDPEVAG